MKKTLLKSYMSPSVIVSLMVTETAMLAASRTASATIEPVEEEQEYEW